MAAVVGTRAPRHRRTREGTERGTSAAYSSTGHRGEKELPVGDAEMMLLR